MFHLIFALVCIVLWEYLKRIFKCRALREYLKSIFISTGYENELRALLEICLKHGMAGGRDPGGWRVETETVRVEFFSFFRIPFHFRFSVGTEDVMRLGDRYYYTWSNCDSSPAILVLAIKEVNQSIKVYEKKRKEKAKKIAETIKKALKNK